MELKRVVGRDARSATDKAITQFGKDVLVISTSRVGTHVELIVAIEGLGVDSSASPSATLDERLPSESAFGEVLSAARETSRSVTVKPDLWTPPLVPTPPQGGGHRVPPDPSFDSVPAQDVVRVIREEMASLRREVVRAQRTRGGARASVRAGREHAFADALDEAGVPAGLQALLLGNLRPDETLADCVRTMADVLQASMRMTTSELPSTGIHAVCGTSGAGKTLAAVRIARQAAVAATRGRIAVVSFADQRPGAWARLQVLGASIGVETFRACDLDALRAILNDLGEQSLAVVDTASPEPVSLTLEMVSLDRAVEVHVVMPVDVNQAVLNRLLRGDPGHSCSVMLSKLDEAVSPWSLIRTLCSHSLRVSGVGASDGVDDDFQPADARRLIEVAMRQILGLLNTDRKRQNSQNDPDELNYPKTIRLSVPHE